ncbi:hypothetical protein ACM66B_004000 [Microbotryomycetes sp. NB124-2]
MPPKGTNGKQVAPKQQQQQLQQHYDPAPQSTSYEFGGPAGALGVTLAVPFFAYWLSLACTPEQCPPWPMSNFVNFHKQGWHAMHSRQWWQSLWSNQVALVYLAWYAWTVVCWLVLPGQEFKGVQLRDGSRLTYKINAFATTIATVALIAGIAALYGIEPLLYIPTHYIQLISASIAMSAFQAFLVYAMSYSPALWRLVGRKDAEQPMLALGGNTSSALYNWFIGRGLNPRIGSFDIKSFNELRPGMILWLVIDLAMIAKQYNDIGRVTDSILLTVAFHAWYILDAEYNETAIFTTMDITTDGFGFMLSVGDLLWVPFTYSTTARYLALHPTDIGVVGTIGILAIQFIGYSIFRGSNNEKNEFRKGNNPKNLKYMETERGTKLLISGWWGLSRHPNYMGDWLMAWAWCLPAGFSSPVPYYYVIFFAILLIHRQIRDDEACAHKYKKDWEKYKELVPSRIIPYVY